MRGGLPGKGGPHRLRARQNGRRFSLRENHASAIPPAAVNAVTIQKMARRSWRPWRRGGFDRRARHSPDAHKRGVETEVEGEVLGIGERNDAEKRREVPSRIYQPQQGARGYKMEDIRGRRDDGRPRGAQERNDRHDGERLIRLSALAHR